MRWLNKIIGIGALALGCLTFSPKSTEACSGAAPAGRSYTNIALADDASAVYYNPAGLVQLERPEIDLAVGTGDYSYKYFLCYGQPLDSTSAIGFNVSHRTDEWDWLSLSYSRELTENLSVGANLGFNREKYINSDGIDAEKQYVSADFGVLYKGDKLNLGLLLQGNGYNVRPGVCFKFNDRNMLLLEGYNILDLDKAAGIRLGLERKVGDKWSFRAGYRKGEFDDSGDNIQAFTLGASCKHKDLEASIALDSFFQANFNYYNNLILSLNKKF
jgi:hypothetical protein